VSGGLGGRRPLAELCVAHQPQFPARLVPVDHVRAGGRYGVGADVVIRCSGGDGEGERQGELVQELGVGAGQPERDRVGLIVDNDPR
jgi:hypothetical protein